MNINQKEFIVRRSLMDNYPRKLILNEEFVKFENSDLYLKPFLTFDKDDIIEYKFGINLMGYGFTFGREYLIFIRNNKNEVIKINFKTYFGNKTKEYNVLFDKILDSLWDFYFSNITDDFINKFYENQEFNIGNIYFTKDQLIIKKGTIFNKKEEITIIWKNVRTSTYQKYFVIYSEMDPVNINVGFSYLDDWNSGVLWSVLQTLLKNESKKS